ncbi:hypothetical protein WR25_25537 [Diploscapter pachys]|uniref:Uncharacterized protein n=1 Tax=Diploscapter pachys TaxID=2018661 RepID=A0A2A2JFH4_9BILA|nr:hypothetical protein WR25_25537 [Diploscapter pachys]
MSKLRYLNKKPLCLQYAITNPSYARKHHYSGSKRKEPSFIMIILIGLCRLVVWLVVNAHKSLLDFLLKPADELFPSEYDCRQESHNVTYPTPIPIRRPRRCGLMRRDFGRTARMLAIQDRQAAMCYF